MDNVREKILLLLLGGLALGCARTPGKQRMVYRMIASEWKRFNQKELKEGIYYLHRLNYIDVNNRLTKKGKFKALNCQLDNIKNKKEKWDGKWRMVAFDIPEKYKRGRNALRQKLKKIGFCQLQQSVFATPYRCEKEMKELIEYFEMEKYVRIALVEWLDNEKDFKKNFKLN